MRQIVVLAPPHPVVASLPNGNDLVEKEPNFDIEKESGRFDSNPIYEESDNEEEGFFFFWFNFQFIHGESVGEEENQNIDFPPVFDEKRWRRREKKLF